MAPCDPVDTSLTNQRVLRTADHSCTPGSSATYERRTEILGPRVIFALSGMLKVDALKMEYASLVD